MLRLDAAIARPAARQHGLATSKQLLAGGLTREAVDVRVAAEVLRIVHRGVYHHTAVPFTERSRLMAAVLAAGAKAVASHRSAAVLHGFDGVRRYRPEVLVRGTGLPLLHGVTCHRTTTLAAVDRCIVDRIPATSPARTLLDLGAVLPYEVVEHVVQVALIERRVAVPALVAVLERVGRRGRNGTAPLRAVVREALPDEKLQSMLEHALHTLIKRSRVPAPELQHPLLLDTGELVYLDFAWPELRLAVEADGHRWHATKRDLERDLARSRAIQRLGWAHHRYGWDPIHDHGSALLREIQALVLGSVSS